MSGDRSLLHTLIDQAFRTEASGVSKTAGVEQQRKVATGLTDTKFVEKLAASLDYLADGLIKEAGPVFGFAAQPEPAGGVPYDETGPYEGEAPERQAAGVFTGYPPEDIVDAGTVAFNEASKYPGPTSSPLGDAGSETDELLPGGYPAPGIDYNQTVLASLRKRAAMRAKAAEARVLNRVKAAMLRKRAQASPGSDASVPPADTVSEPLPEANSGVGEPSSFTTDDPLANVPQSTESVMALTNQDVDEALKEPLESTLGTEAVEGADADTVEEELFAGASGEGDSGAKQAELASLLHTSLLTRIAQGG